MRIFSTIDKVCIFASPLLIGVDIHMNLGSIIYILIIGWALIGMSLFSTKKVDDKAIVSNKASIKYYFSLISKSELVNFILIRFLVTSILIHSIYSILLVDS